MRSHIVNNTELGRKYVSGQANLKKKKLFENEEEDLKPSTEFIYIYLIKPFAKCAI